ncbi:hypothetical protein [Streptomyces sp. NPDC059134]
MADEFGYGRSEDGVEVGEDASSGGRGGQTALGHHRADRSAEAKLRDRL